MATRAIFTPFSAEFSASNPQLKVDAQRRPVLAFDATTQESCQWSGVAPQGLSGTLTAVITYKMASATTGGVAFDVSLEAVSDGDALDLDAAESFDAVNGGSVAAVPGTAGYIDQISITLTNADAIAAGDYFRLRLARDVADAADTASGDCEVLAVELRDAA